MAYRGRGRSRSRYGSRSGASYAQQHIDERHALSRDLGGADRDVEKFLFSLRGNALERVLLEYGRHYGQSALGYARQAMPRWQSGEVKMSGLVAGRLFDLLPSHMPDSLKYKVIEKLWKQHSPSSRYSITFSNCCAIEDIRAMLQNRFDTVVAAHEIPERLRERFAWLAGNDVSKFQQILKHFFEQDKAQAAAVLEAELRVVMNFLKDQASPISSFTRTFELGKHTIEIHFDPRSQASTPWEGRPAPPPRQAFSSDGAGCLLMLLIGLGILVASAILRNL